LAVAPFGSRARCRRQPWRFHAARTNVLSYATQSSRIARGPMPAFSKLTDLPARPILDGAIQGRYVHVNAMTIGEVSLNPNTVVPMHAHPHEQLTYVIEGRFQFTVGSETTVLEPGMVALIPGGVTHGGTTLTACKVIDIFSPIREDYRQP
jgi:quercetin dioxygenase-like cupin family protein